MKAHLERKIRTEFAVLSFKQKIYLPLDFNTGIFNFYIFPCAQIVFVLCAAAAIFLNAPCFCNNYFFQTKCQ